MHGIARLALLALVLCSTACAFGGDTRAARNEVSDSAGVTIVSNGSPKFESMLVRESLRIGRVDGTGPDLFSDIVPIAVDTLGNIYVGNGGSTSVRVFDRGGVFITEFGRRGQGPAEIRTLNKVLVGHDTVVLVDYQRGVKLLLFKPSGEFIDSRIVPTINGIRLVPERYTAAGWVWAQVREQVPTSNVGSRVEVSSRFVISGVEAPERASTAYEAAALTFFITEDGPVLGLFPQWSLMGFDGLANFYVSTRGSYSVDVSDRRGLLRSIRRSVEPRRITREDVAALRSHAIGVIDTMKGLPASHRAEQRSRIAEQHNKMESLPLPAVYSPIRRLLVSHDGSFWAQRAVKSIAQWEAEQMMFGAAVPGVSQAWDLFDSAGHWVGSVELPARFRADAVVGRSVYGVALDESDVEFVVRYDAVEQ